MNMYNKITENVDLAMREYQKLSNQFTKFISSASTDLQDMDTLVINKTTSSTLTINVVGLDIKITYSMVFNQDFPVGQISAILIKNKDTSTESEAHILSNWFDEHGNVNYPSIEQSSTYNMSQNNYLKKLIYQIIHTLSSSQHMAPYSNNG